MEIVRLAVEYDEGTLVGEDPFDEELNVADYPASQVHLILNQSQPIPAEVLSRCPNGRVARIVKRSLDLITDPGGSHRYTRETALSIYGLRESDINY